VELTGSDGPKGVSVPEVGLPGTIAAGTRVMPDLS
jgi:hypothetical protein